MALSLCSGVCRSSENWVQKRSSGGPYPNPFEVARNVSGTQQAKGCFCGWVSAEHPTEMKHLVGGFNWGLPSSKELRAAPGGTDPRGRGALFLCMGAGSQTALQRLRWLWEHTSLRLLEAMGARQLHQLLCVQTF